MPFEIKLSQLQDRAQFEQAVAEHIQRLTDFSKEVGKPRPVAHPLIEAAVARISYPKADKKPDAYEASYIIVDDTPPPPPPLNLEDRKHALVASVRAAEAAAKEVVMPQRKLRLHNIRYGQAMSLSQEMQSDDDKLAINTLLDIVSKFTAIELKAAQAESDIEDLTDDTVDSFQVPDFG
jgi:hypothetical protein